MMSNTDCRKGSFSSRLQMVQQRIAAACSRAGRDKTEVTLVAVSKTFPFSCILPAVAAGQLDFGENYMQDALCKIEEAERRNIPARWHFIGHLQRNKARFLDSRFVLFHALDTLALARRLSHYAEIGDYQIELLVQVNLAEEPSKGGVNPGALFAFLEELRYINRIQVAGLMTIPPPARLPDDNRKWFAGLRELFLSAKVKIMADVSGFKHLSMGMSGDFEVAVEEGATIVRIGTLLFGPRGLQYE